jgi:hypothetical protein
MAEGRGRAAWQQISLLAAAIVNSNPFRDGPPAEPADFDPYQRPAEDQQPLMVPFSALKSLYAKE